MDKDTFEFLRDWFAVYGLICTLAFPLYWMIEALVEKFLSRNELIDEEQKWLIG
jgi:hypothetical protein